MKIYNVSCEKRVLQVFKLVYFLQCFLLHVLNIISAQILKFRALLLLKWHKIQITCL